jgi:hypothetical protein
MVYNCRCSSISFLLQIWLCTTFPQFLFCSSSHLGIYIERANSSPWLPRSLSIASSKVRLCNHSSYQTKKPEIHAPISYWLHLKDWVAIIAINSHILVAFIGVGRRPDPQELEKYIPQPATNFNPSYPFHLSVQLWLCMKMILWQFGLSKTDQFKNQMSINEVSIWQ